MTPESPCFMSHARSLPVYPHPYGFRYRDLGFGNIRLNRGHSDTVFRVNVTGLQRRTTYYYEVTSTESDGTSDGVTSSVSQFTTASGG